MNIFKILRIILIFLFIACGFVLINGVKADVLGSAVVGDNVVCSDAFRVFSPQDRCYNQSTVLLNFTLSWQNSIGTIGYSLDDDCVAYQVITNYVSSDNAAPFLSFSSDRQLTVMGTLALDNLKNGNHTLRVYHGHQAASGRYDVDAFTDVKFSIDSPAIQLIQNQSSYNSGDIPLRLLVSEPTLWISYSIDNQANVTVSGNTTLTNLANGSHSLIAYAEDNAGNIGYSKIVYFTVNNSVSKSTSKPADLTSQIDITPLALIVEFFVFMFIIGFLVIKYKQAKKELAKSQHSALRLDSTDARANRLKIIKKTKYW
jgi:uncharacterized protein (UPF0333 family)